MMIISQSLFEKPLLQNRPSEEVIFWFAGCFGFFWSWRKGQRAKKKCDRASVNHPVSGKTLQNDSNFWVPVWAFCTCDVEKLNSSRNRNSKFGLWCFEHKSSNVRVMEASSELHGSRHQVAVPAKVFFNWKQETIALAVWPWGQATITMSFPNHFLSGKPFAPLCLLRTLHFKTDLKKSGSVWCNVFRSGWKQSWLQNDSSCGFCFHSFCYFSFIYGVTKPSLTEPYFLLSLFLFGDYILEIDTQIRKGATDKK